MLLSHDAVTGVEHTILNQVNCARRMMNRSGIFGQAEPRQHQSIAAQVPLLVTAAPFSNMRTAQVVA